MERWSLRLLTMDPPWDIRWSRSWLPWDKSLSSWRAWSMGGRGPPPGAYTVTHTYTAMIWTTLNWAIQISKWADAAFFLSYSLIHSLSDESRQIGNKSQPKINYLSSSQHKLLKTLGSTNIAPPQLTINTHHFQEALL